MLREEQERELNIKESQYNIVYFDESQLTLLTIHFQLTHRVISDQGKHLEERYLIDLGTKMI